MKNKLLYLVILGCLFTFIGSMLVTKGSSITVNSQFSEFFNFTNLVSQYESKLGETARSSTVSVLSSNNIPSPSTNLSGKKSSVAAQSCITQKLPDSKSANTHYTDGALFIGDSRTEGLMTCSDLSDATFYAAKGLMVNTIFTKPVVETKSGKITIINALKASKFSKVYIMLGINELGWSSIDMFIADYSKIIDVIKSSQPNAKIYVEPIFPVTEKRSRSDKIYNNSRIKTFNQWISKMVQEKGVTYLDVSPALTDKSGALCADATTDGIHLNHAYCQKWCDFLKENEK